MVVGSHFRCVLALDLRSRSEGALAFASWLIDRESSDEVRVLPTCVFHRDLRPRALLYEPTGNLQAHTIEALRAKLREHGVLESFEEVAAFESTDVAGALRQQCELFHAECIVVGRKERGLSSALTLGSVTRQLMGQHALPIIVVPTPAPGDVGEGPIVLAADPTRPGERVASFASRLAAVTGCEVDALPSAPSSADAPHPLPTAKILEHAARVGACMIVCGADAHKRRPEIMQGGPAHDIAARSACPVVVVPTEAQPVGVAGS
jgi:nucleotide-binding universal stress UspA family protein